MVYEIKKDNLTYFYNVTYDKEKLIKILEELKNYKYNTVNQGKIAISSPFIIGNKKNIKKNIIFQFNKKHSNSSNIIYPDTIVCHHEKNSNFVNYQYNYDKLPSLYYFIDILLNNKSVMYYGDLFDKKAYTTYQDNQIILDAVLKYINSEELLIISNIKDYDYIGLNKLYKETLESFNYKLVAIKKDIDLQEPINGLIIQKKMSLNNK